MWALPRSAEQALWQAETLPVSHIDIQANPASRRHGIMRGWVIIGLALMAWVLAAGLFGAILAAAGALPI